jgi:hypothetical protein
MKNVSQANQWPMYCGAVLALVFSCGTLLPSALAQSTAKSSGGPKAAFKGDKTGTNPINFTHDLRVYNEYQFLNTPGDGSQNITTLEFRTPFSDGKYQFRFRARGQELKVDANDDGFDEISDGGLGDFDFRFLAVPYMDMKKKFAVAVGFETFLPSATEDSLGSGALSFGPQVFGVFFAPFGIKGTLIAPAYQHKFSVDEESGRDEVHQGLIDIFLLWISPKKQYWVLGDPQIILDYEQDKEFALIDFEAGMMLDKFITTKGHSVYVRPSFGVGSDRAYDHSYEVGYKVIW